MSDMDFGELLNALRDPGAYPDRPASVDVRQTHISAVFLAGDHAYKIKKPLNLGFLDFSTLEKRLHACREEVRLNRRLAPDVYLDVVPVVREGGRIRIGGAGEVIEHAVRMRRLPEDATLLSRLDRGELDESTIVELARRIAEFHEKAERSPAIARGGRWESVASIVRENLAAASTQSPAIVAPEVARRLSGLTERRLEEARGLMERRAAAGTPCDCHGDLHLDHVYWFPDRRPPGDFVIVDCIEFSERFRRLDPVADAAFFSMDLAFRGRRDLAAAFTAAYARAAGDEEGVELLPLYQAYRAMVRGKVEGLAAAEPEIPEADRDRLTRLARGRWLLALGELEDRARRPCLVLVGGLPGTGKSTVAGFLAAEGGFRVISTDVVRKGLAGASGTARAAFGEGLYTPEWNERTYEECLRRARNALRLGGRVAVDASFREDARRRAFLDAATELGTPSLLLLCEAAPQIARRRLESRSGGVSDADWPVHKRMAELWEPLGAQAARSVVAIDAGGELSATRRAVFAALARAGLGEEVGA